jgi:hypothetical protein
MLNHTMISSTHQDTRPTGIPAFIIALFLVVFLCTAGCERVDPEELDPVQHSVTDSPVGTASEMITPLIGASGTFNSSSTVNSSFTEKPAI